MIPNSPFELFHSETAGIHTSSNHTEKCETKGKQALICLRYVSEYLDHGSKQKYSGSEEERAGELELCLQLGSVTHTQTHTHTLVRDHYKCV